MGTLQEVSANGTLASDNWRAVTDLLGIPAKTARINIKEGFLNVLLFDAVFMYVMEGGAAPSTSSSSGGDVIRAANSMSTFGPSWTPGQGYRLDRLYVRNSSAGSNAKLAFEGTVEVF